MQKNKIIILAMLICALGLMLSSCTVDQGEIVELTQESDSEAEDTTDEQEAETTEEDLIEEDSTEEEDELEDSATEDDSEETTEEEVEEEITLIELTDEGFSPDELTIAAGTTVTFTNVREGAYPDEVVMGVRSARGIDSEELTPGDSWEYTFSETGEFEFVGQYLTTYSLEIIVE